jgi:hypothetical protein
MIKRPVLITVRLAEMKRVHPQQITGECERCHHQVGIYPSGQRIMREFPGIEVLCAQCAPHVGVSMLAPGALDEPKESVRRC